MRTSTGWSIFAPLVLLGLSLALCACSEEPTARLPDNVTVAIVYNEQAERWHAGAIVFGNRPESLLRVLCLTEAGKPEGDHGGEHTGINIDAQPGNLEGRSGADWSWRLDGQPWEGGRWGLDFNTSPATVANENADVELALLRDLRTAKMAELSNSRDGEEVISVQFDLTALFDTPAQFAIEECNADAIEQRAGEYHSAYAYWIPEWERHSITLIERDSATDHRLLLSCGPTGWTDDDASAWIREAEGEVYAAATLMGFRDETSHSHDQADASTAESATVSWVDGDGNAGMAVWDVDRSWVQPASAHENLRFIDALRASEELIVTVEMPDAGPTEIKVRGAALFAKPLGAELEACIREYADLNG